MVSRLVLAACCCVACGGSLTLAQTAPPATRQSPAQPKLQLQDLPPDPHTLTPAELEQLREEQVLQAAVRLASVQAHWGPDLNTPGASIALAEVKRAKTAEGTQVTYRITATGFTPADKLTLVRWPLNAEAHAVMGDIGVDAKGQAVCAANALADARAALTTGSASAQAAAPAPPSGLSAPAPQGNAAPAAPQPPDCGATLEPQQPIEVQAIVAPGEAVRVALLTADRKRGAATSAIPFPIENTDKGCKLAVILGMKDAAMVLIDGTGFPANTPLTFDAVTGTTTRPLHPKTNAEGRIVFPLLTGAKGQTSGETTVRFAGVNHQPTLETPSTAPPTPDPDCAPSVSYPWGAGSYKVE